MSDFYNNIGVNRQQQNQITASLFYSIAPFHPKTIARHKNLSINPDNTIEGVFQNFGGRYFRFFSEEEISIDDFPFQIFCWFSPYFDLIVKSEQFKNMTTIELDVTFSALDPYKICIPLLIFRNTGIPLGIIASVSETASLYSIFFEALKKLDSENQNNDFSYFELFQAKKYLTDEHRSFIKVQKEYNIEIYHCYVHLIRSVGANSLLGFLLSDILYQYSIEERKKNYERFFHTFKLLYEKRSDISDKTRFDKISEILGKDPEGNKIKISRSYAPIYERIADNIPTSTNHIESFHKHINEITKGLRTLTMRLAYICKYIIDRTLRSNNSSKENLKAYLKRIKDKASDHEVSINQKQLCDCSRKLYYSRLYGINVPCIHEILQLNDDKIIIESFKEYDLDFTQFAQNELEIYDIETDLKFKNDDNSNNQDNQDDLNQSKLILISPDDIIEDDIIEHIVKNTERQLKDVISKYKIDVAVLSLKLYKEMMDDEKLKNLEEAKFWATFQVRLWLNILKNRRVIRI